MADTVFNNEEKKKKTQKEVSDYFQTGTNYGDVLKSKLGDMIANKDAMTEALKRRVQQSNE